MSTWTGGELYDPRLRQWPQREEYNWRAGVHELRIFWPQPAPQEIATLTHGLASFALVTEADQLFLLWSLLGVTDWSDLPYAWWRVAPEERTLPFVGPTAQAVDLDAVLINSRTGRIHAIRQFPLPAAFAGALHQAIRVAALPLSGR